MVCIEHGVVGMSYNVRMVLQ